MPYSCCNLISRFLLGPCHAISNRYDRLLVLGAWASTLVFLFSRPPALQLLVPVCIDLRHVTLIMTHRRLKLKQS